MYFVVLQLQSQEFEIQEIIFLAWAIRVCQFHQQKILIRKKMQPSFLNFDVFSVGIGSEANTNFCLKGWRGVSEMLTNSEREGVNPDGWI